MAQRLSQQRQLYYGVETTEGTEVVGAGANAIAVTHLAVNPDVAFNARPVLGQFGSIAGKMGAQTDPGLSFTVQCRGGAATSSVVPSIDPLLKSVLSAGTQDTGAAIVQAGSTVSVVNVDSVANFTVGNAVAVETGSGTNAYEVGWIQAMNAGSTPKTITLSHDLTFAPMSAARVKPSITYKPKDATHDSLSFQVWLDAVSRVSFVGCKGTMKLDAPRPGAIPTLTFNWRAINWAHVEGGTRPTPTYDTATSPTTSKFKIGSVPYDVKLANWNLRQSVARKSSQNSTYGTTAQLITDRDLVGVLQAYDVDNTQFANWKDGLEQAIAHQFGTTQYNMVAYQIQKAQRRDVSYGDDNGLTTNYVAFQGNIISGADEIRLAFL